MVSLYIPCHVWNFGVRKLMISLEQLRMCNACGYRGWLSHGCISFYSRLWVKEARFGVSSHEEEVISKHCNMPMSSTASLVRYCITYVQGTQVNLWLLLRLFWGEKKKKNEEGEGMKYFGNRSWGKINSSGQKLLISCASNASWRFQRHGTIVFVEKLPVTQSCIKNLSMFNTSCQFRFSKFYGKNISSVSFLSLLVPASFDCSLRLYHVSLLFFECKKVSVSSFPSQSLLH